MIGKRLAISSKLGLPANEQTEPEEDVIEIIQGDITTLAVDAIVNAANSALATV